MAFGRSLRNRDLFALVIVIVCLYGVFVKILFGHAQRDRFHAVIETNLAVGSLGGNLMIARRDMLEEPHSVFQTSVGMAVAPLELLSQFQSQTSRKKVILLGRPNPDGHGVIDVGNLLVAVVSLLVFGTMDNPPTVGVAQVPSGIKHLSNF